MASQHIEDGSFLFKPKNRSSVLTFCFRIISYLHKDNTLQTKKTALHLVIFFKIVFSSSGACNHLGLYIMFVLLRLWSWVCQIIILWALSHLFLAPDIFAAPFCVDTWCLNDNTHHQFVPYFKQMCIKETKVSTVPSVFILGGGPICPGPICAQVVC